MTITKYKRAPVIVDHLNKVGQLAGLTDNDFQHLDLFIELSILLDADNDRP